MPDEYKDFDREDCPFCHGSGERVAYDDEDDREDSTDTKCPDCGGTGWLPL